MGQGLHIGPVAGPPPRVGQALQPAADPVHSGVCIGAEPDLHEASTGVWLHLSLCFR